MELSDRQRENCRGLGSSYQASARIGLIIAITLERVASNYSVQHYDSTEGMIQRPLDLVLLSLTPAISVQDSYPLQPSGLDGP